MKNAGYILRLTATLFLIAAVVAAALAGVNALTAGRIAELRREKLQSAIAQVLPGAESPSPVDFTDDTGLVQTVYAAPGIGYAVEVAPAGFGGPITMMVGVGLDGRVLGISVVSHTETPGLGAKAGAKNAAGSAFRDSFIGLFGEAAVSKDGGQADTITGATITSRAVAQGVTAALKCVAGITG